MQQVNHHAEEILRTNRPLVRHIVSITSKRRRLSETEEEELSRFVVSEMSGPDANELGPYRGLSSLKSYLAVVVQRLYDSLAGTARKPPPEPSRLSDAIDRINASLPPREALILKMWFESGMTTQKIATVLGLDPNDVHCVIAQRTDGVHKSLTQSPPHTD